MLPGMLRTLEWRCCWHCCWGLQKNAAIEQQMNCWEYKVIFALTPVFEEWSSVATMTRKEDLHQQQSYSMESMELANKESCYPPFLILPHRGYDFVS